jgi:hypothetical protein
MNVPEGRPGAASRRRLLRPALCLAGFIVLATLNSAGYRYGASDQAFYAPAVLLRTQPDIFPRDAQLIRSQARLTFVDETIAALAELSGVSIPVLFLSLYLVSLTLLVFAIVRIASAYYASSWATVALLAGLTMRHAIAKSGTNTLESYFHPRQLAFALGACGLAWFLRGRYAGTAAFVVASGLVHPTTALWFAVWLSVAFIVSKPHVRVAALGAAATGAAVGLWAITFGPLAGRLARMDPEWVATLAVKDYLFPLQWPWTVWLINLAYIPLIVWLHRRRRRAGLSSPTEDAVVVGCLSLVVVFLVTLPFNAARVQLAIQLQPARIFWMLDLLASVYAVWGMTEWAGVDVRRARTVALIVIALSAVRAVYVGFIETPGRPVVAIGIPDTDWGRVMAWARRTPSSSHWLADPMHAVRYGTSVRVAGERDVLVEGVKDQAIGMYDRGVAMRTRDRLAAVGDFQTLTSSRARELAVAFGLDYLVTDRALDLPLVYSSGPLRVYQLR